MKLYNLIADDSPVNDWVFWYEDKMGVVRPRQIYADLVCANCGKLDEIAAIARGIDQSTVIRSRRDFIALADGFIAVTARFKELLEANGGRGLRFVGLPRGERWLLWPEVRVHTDMPTAGFEFLGPQCSTCGRYREVCVGPLSRSLAVPDDPMTVFSSEIWNENARGRVLWLFAQEPISALLKQNRVSGLEIIKAL
jgi:hypothetical protein